MFRPVFALFLLAAPAAVASAESHNGRWTLESAAGGCIVHAASPNGTVLSVWGTAGDTNLSFLVQNRKHAAFEDGGRYDIQVSFDGHRAWPMQATARLNLDSDGPGLTFPVNPSGTPGGAGFLEQFAAADGMHIARAGSPIDSLALADTRAAMGALARCLEQVWSRSSSSQNSPESGEVVVTTLPVGDDAETI